MSWLSNYTKNFEIKLIVEFVTTSKCERPSYKTKRILSFANLIGSSVFLEIVLKKMRSDRTKIALREIIFRNIKFANNIYVFYMLN